MTWNLVTVAFGDQKYKQGQQFLTKQAKECDVNHIQYTDDDLLKGKNHWASFDDPFPNDWQETS